MKQSKDTKKNPPKPEPEPESDYNDDDLSDELNAAGEDFDESDDMIDYPEFDWDTLYGKYFVHDGRNMAEIANGIQESLDANSKCLLKFAKELRALTEVIAKKQ